MFENADSDVADGFVRLRLRNVDGQSETLKFFARLYIEEITICNDRNVVISSWHDTSRRQELTVKRVYPLCPVLVVIWRIRTDLESGNVAADALEHCPICL